MFSLFTSFWMWWALQCSVEIKCYQFYCWFYKFGSYPFLGFMKHLFKSLWQTCWVWAIPLQQYLLCSNNISCIEQWYSSKYEFLFEIKISLIFHIHVCLTDNLSPEKQLKTKGNGTICLLWVSTSYQTHPYMRSSHNSVSIAG